MQKLDKKKSLFLFQFSFKQANQFQPSLVSFFLLFGLQFSLYSLKLYQLINPAMASFSIATYQLMLVMLGVLLGAYVILTILSIYQEYLRTLWGYANLLFEALAIIYVEFMLQTVKLHDDPIEGVKYKILAVVILLCYSVLVIGLRCLFYYPFYATDNYLSMKHGYSLLIMYLYQIVLVTVEVFPILESKVMVRTVVLIATVFVFVVCYESAFTHLIIRKLQKLLFTHLLWVSTIIYLISHLHYISVDITHYDQQKMFWYIWGYTAPIMFVYGITTIKQIHPRNGWHQLFLLPESRIRNIATLQIGDLYLMCQQLWQNIDKIRKSELKTNDPAFKHLWIMVSKHNQLCLEMECPLKSILALKIDRNDAFLESKRFSKCTQACLEFGSYHLLQIKDIYPYSIGLLSEIANYQLHVFQNRQKGLLMFNKYYSLPDTTFSEKYALFYLKKKIEAIYAANESCVNNNAQNQLSEFRHSIQVSVTTLAEFWYFLADPKCNLKKLYDLTNIMFPLKIGVDKDWIKIQKIKNIESYNIYARYLISMFNDKEKGMKILQQAKKVEQESRKKEEVEVNVQGITNFLAEENGIVFLEMDGKSSGNMYQVNLAAEKLFGYGKGQLLDRKVNDIMPVVLAAHHDKILQRFQETNKTRILNKEKQLWGKSKDGYMFPLTILLRPIKNFYSQNFEVYGTFKKELWVKESAFLILDLNFMISDMSASLLGIYPELQGRIGLKKKMSVTEIMQNFQKIKDNLRYGKSHDLMISRNYSLGNGEFFEQEFFFTLNMTPIEIGVEGVIGYFLKFQKARDLGNHQLVDDFNIAERDFLFTYVIEEDENNFSKLKYLGGCGNNKNNQVILEDLLNCSRFNIEKNSFIRSQDKEEQVFINYAEGIKAKRLQDRLIKEIHSVSEDSEYDLKEVEENNEEKMHHENVKPSDLNQLLERKASSTHIIALNILTVGLLVLASSMFILQYGILYQNHHSGASLMHSIKETNQLQAQISYMKMFINYFSLYQSTSALDASFNEEITIIDHYLQQKTNLNRKIQVTYSDGTDESMILSFALRKLVSECNKVSMAAKPLDPDLSFVFYGKYNTVNGIIIGMEESKQQEIVLLNEILLNNWQTNLLFLICAFVVYLICIIAMNVILRLVLHKKAQILEIFFELPRGICATLQKECQRFIQRLSTDDYEADNMSLNMAEGNNREKKDTLNKRNKQKKRTVLGEEQTKNRFLLVTLLFLVYLLVYHQYLFIDEHLQKDIIKQEFISINQIFALEEMAAETMSIINSFISDQTMPLHMNSQPYEEIKKAYVKLTEIQSKNIVNFYKLAALLDDQFESQFKVLFYDNLCDATSPCQRQLGQTEGINSILSIFYKHLLQKYRLMELYYSNDQALNQTEKAILLSKAYLSKEKNTQFLIKKYLERLSTYLENAVARLTTKRDNNTFIFMVTLSVVNLTLLVFLWISYYRELGERMVATQHILAFIPIDEINKHPKIANYIKQEISLK